MTDTKDSVARALDQWAGGDETARDRLVPMVYSELRRIAGGFLRRERADHTLQPTALVHEALLRLYDQRKAPEGGREQLLFLVAQLMRRVLVDHARRKRALRRGAGQTAITFDEALGVGGRGDVDVIELDLALQKLAKLDPRQASVVELRVFGGFEVTEVATLLELSPATIKREWRTAKIWLYHELKG